MECFKGVCYLTLVCLYKKCSLVQHIFLWLRHTVLVGFPCIYNFIIDNLIQMPFIDFVVFLFFTKLVLLLLCVTAALSRICTNPECSKRII